MITSLNSVTQSFIQAQIKENIKAPRYWPLCGEFTGDRWIPCRKDRSREKCFQLVASHATIGAADEMTKIRDFYNFRFFRMII